MPGLYIHIPFCRDACNYCDFHFSISVGHLEDMLEAILLEIRAEKDYLGGEALESIYFGGGTPSLLNHKQIERIFRVIKDTHIIDGDAEITLEANPDDLSPEYLGTLKQTGINRLSIGVQSFREEDLVLMNRRHNAAQSRKCLEDAQKEGFDNLNLDLIYGTPHMNDRQWLENIHTALDYNPAHIAAYHLTYESGTVLDYRRKKGKFIPADETISASQYHILVDGLTGSGFEHYEISNFALPGRRSRHNSAYWNGKKYLGIGPSAHSYDGTNRRWNLPANASYIRGIKEGWKVYREEILGPGDRFHDYLITSLRTAWGLDPDKIKQTWGNKYYEHIMSASKKFIEGGMISRRDEKLVLTSKGMFLADYIIRELFM